MIDSGIGGLSVWKALKSIPDVPKIIYVADSAYMPYGRRKSRDIRLRVMKISDALIQRGCSIVVLACNTATVNAIAALRHRFAGTIFVGVEPAIKTASSLSRNGKIGLLATRSTINSSKVHSLIGQFGKNYSFFLQNDTGLAESIEKNEEVRPSVIDKHLSFVQQKGIDTLILGCSHYPLIISQICENLPKGVQIVSAETGITKRLCRILAERNVSSIYTNEKIGDIFVTTGQNPDYARTFSRVLKCNINFDNELDLSLL